jgi:hypothetical protein
LTAVTLLLLNVVVFFDGKDLRRTYEVSIARHYADLSGHTRHADIPLLHDSKDVENGCHHSENDGYDSLG